MAENNAHLNTPALNPRYIKDFIELLASNPEFQKDIENRYSEKHDYKKIGRISNPHYPISGSFSHYYLGLQYLLHDPRLSTVYESYYKYLNDPKRLIDLCQVLIRNNEIMVELEKGQLYEVSDHRLLNEVAVQEDSQETQEQKIEEQLERLVKKKEEKKDAEKKSSHSSVSASKPVSVSQVVEQAESTAPKVEQKEPKKPPPAVPPPPKIRNPLSFRLAQAHKTIRPVVSGIAKRVSHASFLFAKKYPAVTQATVGAATGGALSVAYGWPGNPLSGIIAGAFAPTIIKKVVQTVIPSSRPEPVSTGIDDEVEPEQEQDDGYSPAQFPQVTHSMRRPGGFSVPGRSLFARGRMVPQATQLMRGTRAATLAARAAPLMANPIFWVVVGIILLILLFFFLFMILATTALLPPFSNPTLNGSTPAQVRLVKSGPQQVANGEKIQYKIEVTYTGVGIGTAEINDVLPTNVRYLQSSPSATINGRTLTWKLTDLQPSLPRPITFEVQPDFNDSWVVNEATGKASQSGSGGATGKGGVCPSDGEISANRKDRNSCRYFGLGVNIFDTTLSQEAIETYIKNYSGTFVNAGLGDVEEFRRRINYIGERSKAVGLNPVIFLGLWKSESNFGAARNAATFGCAPGGGVKSFEEELNCAVGLTADGRRRGSLSAQCASPNNPERDQACQIIKGIRDKHPDIYGNDRISLPISSFDDFVETYGPRSPILDGPGTENNNCIASYNTLVEVALESKSCTVSQSTSSKVLSGSGKPTKCSGNVVNLGYEKILLPLPEEQSCSSTATNACGRPGRCVAPKKIVIHTTYSPKKGSEIFEYFASGSDTRGVGAHFIIDKDGSVIQAVETLSDSVEVAYAVANYADHISLELVHNDVYANKTAAPTAQYAATLKLVKQLMQQYQIPLGALEYSWKSSYDGNNENATPGVYGHYQLNPSNRFDPGDGFLRDLREDLK